MADPSLQRWLRLEIDPVIRRAEHLAGQVQRDLPTHAGLVRAAAGVLRAAQEAKRVSRVLRRPWGLHRLPVYFLAAALCGFAAWTYWQFFHVATLRIALPAEDAVLLHQQMDRSGRVRFAPVVTEGSRESAELLMAGSVDLAFVQGGIELPPALPRLRSPNAEAVLYFVRQGVDHPDEVHHIMTSARSQGSHVVAQVFARYWQIADQVRFSHDWRAFVQDPEFSLPADIDAVFVVKDLAEHEAMYAAERLSAAGFRLTTPDLGAHALTLDYLQPSEIPRGYLGQDPAVPAETVATYAVSTYLAARAGLTPRRLAAAAHLLDRDANSLVGRAVEPSLEDALNVLQGVEAFFGVLIYIGLAFLALLGLEVTTYRRRFNELNTLVSLISMHQSDKDVLGLTEPAVRRENLLYLSLCSDLLGLISVISGYYAQENPSLLYGNMLEIIHARSDGLKLNIQTKIMHASVVIDPPATAARNAGPPPDAEDAG